jgi:DNA-binding transcriptional regulator GbsR (MarR family)
MASPGRTLPWSSPVARPDTPAQTTSDADARAVLLAADAIGELMGFWNFKPSMGRVWTVLYLSRRPLTADEIGSRAQLSAGSVSMTLSDLGGWGVVRRAWVQDDRRRHYEAETDILAMVTRVFRQRELGWIDQVVVRLEEAARILADEGRSSVPDQMRENRFLATRIGNLLHLARAGRRVVDRFAQAGTLDLRVLRDALGRRRKS